MTSAQLQQWIQHPETLNRDTLYELRTWVARYPYFQTLRLLYLKNLYLLHDTDFGAELRKSVLYVTDRRMLFYFIEGDKYILKARQAASETVGVWEDEPGVDRTLSLIDAFLAEMPDESAQDLGLDYSMDYTAYLLQEEPVVAETALVEEETPPLRGQSLIDDFISQNEQGEDVKIEEEMEEPEESLEEEELEEEEKEDPAETGVEEGFFTETLAKIYIKQHRYDKALEIIRKLSLNFPKKNAYFADQIRFLEKLIINDKSK